MPYKTITGLPEYVKKYSETIQRQFMHVFNSVYTKVLKETKSKKQAETRAFKAGNSVLKKRFTQKESMRNNTHADYFSHLLDKYLGNLNG